MSLYYQTVGQGSPVVILHGLLGCSNNWRGIATQLADNAKVITVDLRNHGHSPHVSPHTYQSMADDLLALLDLLELNQVALIGHSMGGKVAMQFTAEHPERVHKLAVVDIAPRQYQDEHSALFQAMLDIDLSQYQQRSQVDMALAGSISDKAVRQFLLMNLTKDDGGVSWQPNIELLYQDYASILASVCQGLSIDTPTLFVAGELSDYIQPDDKTLIESIFNDVVIRYIEQAGHWVHADQPEQFIRHIRSFFEL